MQRHQLGGPTLVLLGAEASHWFTFGPAWECTTETSVPDGFYRRIQQKLVAHDKIQIWVMTKVPDAEGTALNHAVFRMDDRSIHGGSPDLGSVDIIRRGSGFFVSVSSREFTERREWRLERETPDRLTVYDAHETDGEPVVSIDADTPEAASKTMRFLLYELTGLMVAPGYLAWNPDWSHDKDDFTADEQDMSRGSMRSMRRSDVSTRAGVKR